MNFLESDKGKHLKNECVAYRWRPGMKMPTPRMSMWKTYSKTDQAAVAEMFGMTKAEKEWRGKECAS